MLKIFLDGLLWGSFFFLPWGVTVFIGVILAVFFRSFGAVAIFFLLDVMFLAKTEMSFWPQLPLTIFAILMIILGTFLGRYISIPILQSRHT